MGNNPSPLFNAHEFPVDAIHIKAVMPYSNLNQDMIKKYYSPSAVSMGILLEAHETLKAFYGNMYDVEKCDDSPMLSQLEKADNTSEEMGLEK